MTTQAHTTTEPRTRDPLFASLIGLTSLVILLQGLWAGLFIREGKAYDATKAQANAVSIHSWGAHVAFGLAIISLLVAIWRLRARRDLIAGTALLVVLLFVEAWIGGKIGDHPSLPSIHIPLAMVLVALSVWLPMRTIRGARAAAPAAVGTSPLGATARPSTQRS